jgi:hypothetical protein
MRVKRVPITAGLPPTMIQGGQRVFPVWSRTYAAWTIALADHRVMQFYDVPDSVLMPAVTLAEEISSVPCRPVILLGYSVSEEKVEAREFCS